jgi:hypothetical protein
VSRLRNIAIPRFLRPPQERTARTFYWILIAAICALAFFLLKAQKPWDGKLLASIDKREAAGKYWKIEHYVAVFEWGAAAVNLMLAVGLLATLRMWTRGLGERDRADLTPAPRQRRWLLIGLGIAVLIGGYFRVQRLDHSLWSDEEYTVRSHIWGGMAELEDGSLEYRPVAWRDTFFRNKVNNHLGYTIPTRLLHDTWARFAASPGRPFSEPVLRLLPLLASLGSIAIIGLLTTRYAGPIAGLGAAFFLALNPWYLRYSVEARGYSQAIFFLLLVFAFLIPALRRGRWRDWLGFAASELMAMLCVPGTVYVLLLANAIALGILFFQKSERQLGDRTIIAARMLAANLFAAMLFIQMFSPSVPQIANYLRDGPLAGEMSLGWWSQVWVILTSGLSWSIPHPAQHLGSSFSIEAEKFPGLRAFHITGLLALMGIGIVGSIVRRSWLLLPASAVLGGAILAFIQSQLSGNTMHVWYVVYGVIGFVIFIVLGVETLAVAARCLLPGRARSANLTRTATALVMFLFLSLYAISTTTGRALICEHPRHPLRGAVAAARGDGAYAANDGELLTASFGTSKGMITSYDPRNHILNKPAQLEALIATAKADHKQLIVYLCGLERARQTEPEMLVIVTDPALFEQLPPVLGLEELFSYHLFRYVGQ